jgi:hypothetical protein
MVKEINIELYNKKFTLIIGDNNYWIKHLRKKGVSKKECKWLDNEEPLGACMYTKKSGMFMLLRKNSDINTVSHECLHMCARIMDSSDINLNYDTEEAYAYLLGFLTKKVYDTLI